jgi:hypothetical protein
MKIERDIANASERTFLRRQNSHDLSPRRRLVDLLLDDTAAVGRDSWGCIALCIPQVPSPERAECVVPPAIGDPRG